MKVKLVPRYSDWFTRSVCQYKQPVLVEQWLKPRKQVRLLSRKISFFVAGMPVLTGWLIRFRFSSFLHVNISRFLIETSEEWALASSSLIPAAFKVLLWPIGKKTPSGSRPITFTSMAIKPHPNLPMYYNKHSVIVGIIQDG